VPELDYMVLADYVRQDFGVIHIIGAGIDTVTTPAVPTVQPFGVALRISFDTTEQPGQEHHLTVSFIGPDKRVLDANATFLTPPRAPGVPEVRALRLAHTEDCAERGRADSRQRNVGRRGVAR
jgi:hypothetical protein